jgi:hypothetical protein
MHGRKPGQPKKVNWASKVAAQIVPPNLPTQAVAHGVRGTQPTTGFTGGFSPPGNAPMNIPNGVPHDLQSVPPMLGVPVRRKRRV